MTDLGFSGCDEQPQAPDYIRPELMAFAEAMENTLRKHDGSKGGWKDCGQYWLLERLHEELKEADEKWDGKNFRGDYGSVANELIDVANYCMMFWGNTYRHEHGRRDPIPTHNTCNHEQDEREKVLEALKKDLQTRFISTSNQWSKGRNSGLLECCNIIDEELRKGEQS